MNYTNDGVLGKCHICELNSLVKFCPKCDHWFCKTCRGRFFSRGLEALRQIVRGRTPGCCGPLEEPKNG